MGKNGKIFIFIKIDFLIFYVIKSVPQRTIFYSL